MSVLGLYVLLLLLIPSRLVVSPAGGAGSPAQLLGIGMGVWWVMDRIIRPRAEARTPALRIAVLAMVGTFLVSYVVAMMRPIDANEASTADLGLVQLFSWAGVTLLALDGITDRARLEALLRMLAVCAGVVATVGVVQFVTGTTYVDQISIPGLTPNTTLGGVSLREGFNRPPGTSIHPIEFGAVITMLLPMTLHQAMTRPRHQAMSRPRAGILRWLPVAAIASATVMSISRSALLSAVLGLVIVAAAWRPRTRWMAGGVVVAFLAVVFVTIPGMLGSLTGLFTGIQDDSSAQSRTDSYGIAAEYIEKAPFFGRGFATFLPSYRILDNQYLLLLIEVGVMGLASVLALVLCGLVAGRWVRRHGPDQTTRALGQALVASVAAGGFGMALYDGFSFPMASSLFFLVIGLAGALQRLTREELASARQQAV